VGIFNIAQASGQVRKRAGGVSPPVDVQTRFVPHLGANAPARCAAPTLFLHTPQSTGCCSYLPFRKKYGKMDAIV